MPKLFEVTTERCDSTNEIHTEILYVTSDLDSLAHVANHYCIHCEEYGKTLKSVRHVLDITQNIRR